MTNSKQFEQLILNKITLITLTCRIIMQQILLIFGKKTTYTALLGPTRLLISEKSVTYTINRSYTMIWQVRVVSTYIRGTQEYSAVMRC